MSNSKFDGGKSFEAAKNSVEIAVKAGELSRREAHSIIKDARKSYRDQNYDRVMDRRK